MLELRDVSFKVEADTKEIGILEHVSFTLEDNQFVAITGPNGGGKSTLAKIIAGILKPTEGKIFLDGQDITEKSITERAKMGISYAFQQPVRVNICQQLVFVQKIILTVKSMTVFPEVR